MISFQIKPWVAFGLPYLLIEVFYIGVPVVRTDGRPFARSLGIRSRDYQIFSDGNSHPILVPRARRFLVTWSWNEGLWKQPLPDVRKFLTSGHACAEVTDITAHAQKGFLSLTAPPGKQFYFLSSLQRVASLGCFENTDFTQLGFTDNLESKGEDINKNQLNTLLGRRTETINRQIIVWV